MMYVEDEQLSCADVVADVFGCVDAVGWASLDVSVLASIVGLRPINCEKNDSSSSLLYVTTEAVMAEKAEASA